MVPQHWEENLPSSLVWAGLAGLSYEVLSDGSFWASFYWTLRFDRNGKNGGMTGIFSSLGIRIRVFRHSQLL